VARVDHEDDTIWRWVIQHYRFDPERRERRNVIVAAYDSQTEFEAEFARYVEMIRGEIVAGSRSPHENLSGITLEPGHLAAAARGHHVRRAIEHGVSPERILSTGPLPSDMAVLTFTKDEIATEVAVD
jgi:hypothetical protein